MKIVNYLDYSEIAIAGDWKDWLVEQGYALPPSEENPLTVMAIEGESSWALYHPPVGSLDSVEILYVGIPSKEEIEDLIEISVQLIKGPLALLGGIEVSGIMEAAIPASTQQKPKGFGKKSRKREFYL